MFAGRCHRKLVIEIINNIFSFDELEEHWLGLMPWFIIRVDYEFPWWTVLCFHPLVNRELFSFYGNDLLFLVEAEIYFIWSDKWIGRFNNKLYRWFRKSRNYVHFTFFIKWRVEVKALHHIFQKTAWADHFDLILDDLIWTEKIDLVDHFSVVNAFLFVFYQNWCIGLVNGDSISYVEVSCGESDDKHYNKKRPVRQIPEQQLLNDITLLLNTTFSCHLNTHSFLS